MSSNRKSSRKSSSKNVRSNKSSRSRSRSNKRSNKSSRKTKYINRYIKDPFTVFIKCHKVISEKYKKIFEKMMNSNPRSLRVLRGVVPKPTIEQTERTRNIHNEFKNRYDKYIIYYNEIDRIMNLIESNRISKSDLYRDKVSLTSLIVNANKSRIKLLELDPELDRQVTICSKSLHK